jgi:hypothetical protein
MRSLVVEAGDELVELALLLQEVIGCRPGGLEFQGEMHAFVTAVLLWVAGFDSLDLDAEPQPPVTCPRIFGPLIS